MCRGTINKNVLRMLDPQKRKLQWFDDIKIMFLDICVHLDRTAFAFDMQLE